MVENIPEELFVIFHTFDGIHKVAERNGIDGRAVKAGAVDDLSHKVREKKRFSEVLVVFVGGHFYNVKPALPEEFHQ